MQKLKYIVPVLLGSLLAVSCQNKPKTDEEIAQELSIEDIVNQQTSGDQHSQNQSMADTVRVGNQVLRYEIQRISSDTLPVVHGDYTKNVIFYDNIATLKVTSGSRVLYSHTFTKKSFGQFVDADMMEHSILEGLVFDHALPQGLQFAAAVGYPQDDDMFVPVLIKVMTDGSVKIEKDPLNDSASDADIYNNQKGLSDKDLNSNENEDEGV